MSQDDKKRDRALQRRVRERQAKTGESYQAAWRQLTDSTDPPPDEPAEDEGILEVKPPKWLAIPLASLSQTPPLPCVPPRIPTRITARPANGAFDLESLHISSAGTLGGAADWIVNDIMIDGRSQLAQKDLTGALFSSRGVATGRKRAATKLTLSNFDPVERGCELAIIVTYIGPNPEGVPFFASVVGTRPPQRPTVVPISSGGRFLPSMKATISARVQNAPFQIDRLEIEEGWDWIVEDVRISGKSQFVQSGPIPGDLFATTAIASFVSMELCEDGSTIEIDVIYIGLAVHGIPFKGSLEGTVVHDDQSTPPPDLRVYIEVAGKSVGDPVIVTCNWRPPAISDRAP